LKSHDELVLFARKALGFSHSVEMELMPLSGRGSDRAYFRLKWEQTRSAILVNFDPGRIENSYFVGIAEFLFDNGIPVPGIIRHDAAACCILMDDLGDTDLWTLRKSSWETRRILYQKTLLSVHRLHLYPERDFPSGQVKLMEPFSSAYYRWERDYFRANFVNALCQVELKPDFETQLENELNDLAKRLESDKCSLVHRDLQSQNVMVYHDEPFLIDFQGMRFGTRFYDLGSLLCDPYVSFSESERMELLSFYYQLSDSGLDWERFRNAFWEASAQRLMQALGAYGFLGLTRGLQSYLAHVPAGLRNLCLAAENANALPLLLELCERCNNKIRDSKFEISGLQSRISNRNKQ
jgi:N-acetylmuramate 1-kinase